MNWTGGAFARHSRPDRSLTRRQRQHFARARANRLRGRRSLSPWKIAFAGDATAHSSRSRPGSPAASSSSSSSLSSWSPPPRPHRNRQDLARPSTPRTASAMAPNRPGVPSAARPRGHRRNRTGSVHDKPSKPAHDDAAVAVDALTFGEPRVTVFTAAAQARAIEQQQQQQQQHHRDVRREWNLEERKRTLLSRDDWTGTRAGQPPAAMSAYTPPADRRDVGKRRRIDGGREDGRHVRPSQQTSRSRVDGTLEALGARIADRGAGQARREILVRIGNGTPRFSRAQTTPYTIEGHHHPERRAPPPVQQHRIPSPGQDPSSSGAPYQWPRCIEASGGGGPRRRQVQSDRPRYQVHRPTAVLDRASREAGLSEGNTDAVRYRGGAYPQELDDAIARSLPLDIWSPSLRAYRRDPPCPSEVRRVGPDLVGPGTPSELESADAQETSSSGGADGPDSDVGDTEADQLSLRPPTTLEGSMSGSPTPMGSEVSYRPEEMPRSSSPMDVDLAEGAFDALCTQNAECGSLIASTDHTGGFHVHRLEPLDNGRPLTGADQEVHAPHAMPNVLIPGPPTRFTSCDNPRERPRMLDLGALDPSCTQNAECGSLISTTDHIGGFHLNRLDSLDNGRPLTGADQDVQVIHTMPDVLIPGLSRSFTSRDNPRESPRMPDSGAFDAPCTQNAECGSPVSSVECIGDPCVNLLGPMDDGHPSTRADQEIQVPNTLPEVRRPGHRRRSTGRDNPRERRRMPDPDECWRRFVFGDDEDSTGLL